MGNRKLQHLALIILIAVTSLECRAETTTAPTVAPADENPYARELSRFEKEADLVCNTRSTSDARQMIASAVGERMARKLVEIKEKIKAVNLILKDSISAQGEQLDQKLAEAKAVYDQNIKLYQIAVTEGRSSRTPAAIEAQRIKTLRTQKDLELLEAQAQKSHDESKPSGRSREDELDDAYKSLETLAKTSDKMEGLQEKVRTCLARLSNPGKTVEDTVESKTTTYKTKAE